MFPVKSSDLEIWNRLDDNILEVIVPFPKNYPDTKFKQDNKEIAYLKIDFADAKDYVYLMDFYVYSSRLHARSKYANKDEVELTKGLGKKILCYEFVPEISGIRGSLTLVAGRQRNTAVMEDRIEMQTAVGACVYEVRVQDGCGNKRCSADLRGTPGVGGTDGSTRRWFGICFS